MNRPGRLDLQIIQGQTFAQSLQITDNASAQNFEIAAVSTAAKTFTLYGDARAWFVQDREVQITGNVPAANTRYTVASLATYALGKTTVTVTESIPSNAVNRGSMRCAEDNPVDLTGYTVTSVIRDTHGGIVLDTFAVAVTDAALGKLTLSLTAAQTAAVTWARGVYDVKFTSTADTNVWIEGDVICDPLVTT